MVLIPWDGVVLAKPLVTLKLCSAKATTPLHGKVVFDSRDAQLVAWHAANETAVVKMGATNGFNFSCS